MAGAVFAPTLARAARNARRLLRTPGSFGRLWGGGRDIGEVPRHPPAVVPLPCLQPAESTLSFPEDSAGCGDSAGCALDEANL